MRTQAIGLNLVAVDILADQEVPGRQEPFADGAAIRKASVARASAGTSWLFWGELGVGNLVAYRT